MTSHWRKKSKDVKPEPKKEGDWLSSSMDMLSLRMAEIVDGLEYELITQDDRQHPSPNQQANHS